MSKRMQGATLLLLLPVAALATMSTCTQKDGQNNKGTNIEKTARKTSNAGDCCSQCLDTSNCVGYTWRKDNNECWLKSALASLTPDASVVSGSTSGTASDYETFDAKNAYNGHGATEIDTDQTAPTGMTVDTCEKRCGDDAKCDCVTLQHSNGKCWKRSSCVPAKFSSSAGYSTYKKKAQPPSPPPPPAPPAPPIAGWTQYKSKNCYAAHGAQDLEPTAGKDCGTMNLGACQSKCKELAGCVAVTWGGASSGDATEHKCFRRGYVTLGMCTVDTAYDTWISYDAPPEMTHPPKGVTVRVAKGLGTRGYDTARLSLIRYSGAAPSLAAGDIPWDYSSQFKYRWTGNTLSSSVVQLTPGSPQTFSLDGTKIQVKMPKQTDGSIGMMIGDPCIKSPWSNVCSQSESWGYKTILHEVLGSMAAHDDLDYWVMLGDLFYDPSGAVNQEFFEDLPLEAQSKVLGMTLGNHDFWFGGSPSGGSGDSFGNGHMQWYAQDTVASQTDQKQPFDFSVNPSSKNIVDVKNTVWYNMVGNVALLGFANSYSWQVSKPHFQNACQWIASEKPALVVLIGHWNGGGLGCAANMDTDDVYNKITTLAGCSDLGSKLKYFEGHEHCNKITKPGHGFMVGSFGYNGCGNFGLPILDTRNGRAKLNYFPLGDGGKRTAKFDEILGCISAKGYSACTQYADVWLDEAIAVDNATSLIV